MDADLRHDVARMLDRIYGTRPRAASAEIQREADLMAFPAAVAEVFRALPSGDYTRQRLVDRINSSIVARGLARSIGTFD